MSRWKRIATRAVQTSALREQSIRVGRQLAQITPPRAGAWSAVRSGDSVQNASVGGKASVPGITTKRAK